MCPVISPGSLILGNTWLVTFWHSSSRGWKWIWPWALLKARYQPCQFFSRDLLPLTHWYVPLFKGWFIWFRLLSATCLHGTWIWSCWSYRDHQLSQFLRFCWFYCLRMHFSLWQSLWPRECQNWRLFPARSCFSFCTRIWWPQSSFLPKGGVEFSFESGTLSHLF